MSSTRPINRSIRAPSLPGIDRDKLFHAKAIGIEGAMKRILLVLSVGLAACSQPPQQAAAPAPTETSTSSVSGTYVASGKSDQNQVFLEALRITQAGPNTFTGSFETTSIDAIGKITSDSQNVTGTMDGVHVTVTFDQVLSHLNRTGTLENGALTLSWMDKGQLDTERFAQKSDDE